MPSSVKPGVLSRAPVKPASLPARRDDRLRLAWLRADEPDAPGLAERVREHLGDEALWVQNQEKAEADVLLVVVQSDAAELPADLAEELQGEIHHRGARHEPGGLPVFLVLANAERLAHPDDTAGEWLQRIEAAKLRFDQQLRERLPKHLGFGSFHVHVWAVALERPPLKAESGGKEPFGLVELCHQIRTEARRYRARRRAQPWRLQAVVWCLIALLATTIVLAGWLIVERVRQASAPIEEQPDALSLLGELLDRGERLQRFEGFHRRREAGIDWPRWYVEAQAFRDQVQAEQEQRRGAKAKDGPAFAEAFARLERIERNVWLVSERAALFRLVGDRAGRPALLHIPSDFPIDQARTRLDELRRHYPDFQPAPLPGVIPLQAARDLETTARANYEKLLEPARQLVANRLKDISPAGGETPEAWRKLADGWLANRAAVELADWRELAMLLAGLAGGPRQGTEPPDPIVELQTFLRREHFDLPLVRVELHLPDLTFGGKKVTGLVTPSLQMVLRYQPPRGPEDEPRHLMASRKVGDRHVFLGDRAPVGDRSRLRFEPGGRLSAQLRLTDDDGNAWLLTWPAAEARSPVYSFHVLTQAPRLHPANVTDPTRGELAFDVRLILSQPELFQLPDLFPR